MPRRCILYYITDRTAFSGDESARRKRLLEKISEAGHAGVDYIQLRERDLPIRDLELLAREAVSILTKLRSENPHLKTALLINSRTDVALAVRAEGVHLRSNDISAQEVRLIWQNSYGHGRPARAISPPARLIAVSCHSPEDVAKAAAEGANIGVLAPIFEKKGADPLGLESLRQAAESKISVLALGGITLVNSQSCLDAGAAGIAGIRLFQENDIEQVVDNLRGI